MKKLIKKWLSLTLAASMLMSLAACSPGEETTTAAQNTEAQKDETAAASDQGETSTETGTGKEVHGNIEMPLSEDGAELTIWAPIMETNVTDYDTNAMTVWYEELTGVHINWITCQSTDREEKFNLLTPAASSGLDLAWRNSYWFAF